MAICLWTLSFLIQGLIRIRFEMKNVRREPMRTYMTEAMARDLFEKLERYFYEKSRKN